MGMPSITISFTEMAATAVQRGDRGIIAMILKETSLGLIKNPIVCTSAEDVPTSLKKENQEQINLALMGYINAPKKVIAYVIQDSAEDYSEALNYLKTVKFDYLVVPTVETDEQTTAVVSYVKAQRAANKLIKAVLPNTTGDNEGIINYATEEVMVNDKKYTTEQYCARIAGIIAGTPLSISCTYAPLSELTDCKRLTKEEMDAAVDAGFRYAEQSCNHFIAFKLLAIIRDKVFRALRKLCPARLEGRDRGDLISIITSDIELLEVFYAHTISPIAIAVLYTIIMCCYIGSFHWSLALIALIAYICVGVAIPLIVSKASGGDGLRYRTKSGELSSFVLESLRGASETIQYSNGAKRLELMNSMTDDLSEDARRMKNVSGVNTAVTNVCILVFDIIMLLAGAKLYYAGVIGFDGVLITTIALFSSFGPTVALAALGSTLQSTFAAGNRVLDILDEEPVIEELTGNKEIEFEVMRDHNDTAIVICT